MPVAEIFPEEDPAAEQFRPKGRILGVQKNLADFCRGG